MSHPELPLVQVSPAIDLSALPPLVIALAAVVLVVLLLGLLFTLRVLRTLWRMRVASREGKRISREKSGRHPRTNFTRNGTPSDPINIKVIGTGAQLATAFAAAGWYRADEIDLITSIRIGLDTLLQRRYATAPVSNLYLFGRKQDYAFERPGRSVRERDHVRFWDTGERTRDDRPIWLGAATRDVAVEISSITHLPTHRIEADVDLERGIVIRDLEGTGWIVDRIWEPGFGRPVESKNAMGDVYRTDGRVSVLTLADVTVLLPLATQVRSPLVGRIAQILARPLRWMLPRRGRKRAEEQEQEQQQQEAVTPPNGRRSRGG
jgi:hypothetical protein